MKEKSSIPLSWRKWTLPPAPLLVVPPLVGTLHAMSPETPRSFTLQWKLKKMCETAMDMLMAKSRPSGCSSLWTPIRLKPLKLTLSPSLYTQCIPGFLKMVRSHGFLPTKPHLQTMGTLTSRTDDATEVLLSWVFDVVLLGRGPLKATPYWPTPQDTLGRRKRWLKPTCTKRELKHFTPQPPRILLTGILPISNRDIRNKEEAKLFPKLKPIGALPWRLERLLLVALGIIGARFYTTVGKVNRHKFTKTCCNLTLQNSHCTTILPLSSIT